MLLKTFAQLIVKTCDKTKSNHTKYTKIVLIIDSFPIDNLLNYMLALYFMLNLVIENLF